MKRRGSGFIRVDAAADVALRRLAEKEHALAWLKARWGRIVGEPLARKIQPADLAGRRLTLSLLDPAWRKPVEATLPELERRLAAELPAIRPRVVLEPLRPGHGTRDSGLERV